MLTTIEKSAIERSQAMKILCQYALVKIFRSRYKTQKFGYMMDNHEHLVSV